MLGWTCAASALLGLLLGVAMSILLLDRFALENPVYVQRSALPQNGEEMLPLVAQLGFENLPEGLESADSETEPSFDLPDPARGDDQTREAARTQEQVLVLSGGQRVLGVDFDLGAMNDHSNDLEIAKPIHLNGRAVGLVNLAIDQQSRLHVSSEDLSNLLPEDMFARIDTGTRYIAFDELRAGGLDISYDPLADVIEIVS